MRSVVLCLYNCVYKLKNANFILEIVKWFHLHLALLSFGVFTAAGSKENFVPLALPLLYLLVIGFPKKKIFNVFTAFPYSANLLFISWIVLAIVC